MALYTKAKQSPDFLFASQAAHPGRVSAHPDFRGTWSRLSVTCMHEESSKNKCWLEGAFTHCQLLIVVWPYDECSSRTWDEMKKIALISGAGVDVLHPKSFCDQQDPIRGREEHLGHPRNSTF